MNILEIEQLFNSEDTLPLVLEETQETFSKIDDWSNAMKNNVTDNPEEAKKALTELTGCYMDLYRVLAIASTEKKNREQRYYGELKINTENEGKKFVGTVADKEASSYVANYRRIRNIIEGYTNVCDKAISSLQSLLKHMTEELKMERGQ